MQPDKHIYSDSFAINKNKNVFLVIVDQEGLIKFTNSTFRKLLHLKEETTPLNLFDLMRPSECDAVKILLHEIIQGSKNNSLEFSLKNGTYHLLKWNIRQIKIGTAATNKFICTAPHDISPEVSEKNILPAPAPAKSAESPVEKKAVTPLSVTGDIPATTLFKKFLDNTPSFAWIMNMQQEVLYNNKRICSFEQGTDTHLLPATVRDSIAKNHGLTFSSGLTTRSVITIPSLNDDSAQYEITTYRVRDNNLNFVCGEARDITFQRNAELAIAKFNERLLYMTHATSDAIWEWNIQNSKIYRNLVLQNMIGHQLEEADDLEWWYSRIHPSDREKVRQTINDVLDSKMQSWDSEYQFLFSEGHYRTIIDHGFVIYENSQPVRMIGSLKDVTELKELELKLAGEKLRQQNQLAEAIVTAQEKERTNIGHELHDNVNQLLTTAKLFLEMLKPVSGNDIMVVTKTREIILSALSEIRSISKNLVSPQLSGESLKENIEQALHDLQVSGKYAIVFNCHHLEESNLKECMKTAIFRIFQEQLKNIVKHSKAAFIGVTLTGSGENIILRVEDDGIGFDATQKKQGIGLSNIRQRVDLYHGTMQLATSPGNGCIITVSLPLL